MGGERSAALITTASATTAPTRRQLPCPAPTDHWRQPGSQNCQTRGAMRHAGGRVASALQPCAPGPSSNEGQFRMKSTLLGATAVIALTAGAQASEPAGPTITYVPNSIAQSKIRSGPWTLHESAFPRDASGIKPTTSGPPYAGSGFPYKGYCSVIGQVAVNYGLQRHAALLFSLRAPERPHPRRILRLSPAQRAGSRRDGDLERWRRDLDFHRHGTGAQHLLSVG